MLLLLLQEKKNEFRETYLNFIHYKTIINLHGESVFNAAPTTNSSL